MNNINEFPIDKELKDLIANIVTDACKRAGLPVSENFNKWFSRECSEQLISNILDTIIIWENKKLN